jgi:hypothetical protein
VSKYKKKKKKKTTFCNLTTNSKTTKKKVFLSDKQTTTIQNTGKVRDFSSYELQQMMVVGKWIFLIGGSSYKREGSISMA